MKCKVETAAGKCTACPTSGATAGGSRKLATDTCANVRAPASAITTANGGEHVEIYGSHTTESTYAPPAAAANMDFAGAPVATHFLCKTGYAAVFGATLAASKCVTHATVVSTAATPVVVAPYTSGTTAAAAVGEVGSLPSSADCARILVKDIAEDIWGCFNCVPGKVMSKNLNVLVCTGGLTGWDSTACMAASSTVTDGNATAITSTCSWCSSTHFKKATPAVAGTNAVATDTCVLVTTATTNCYQALAGNTACANCNSNAWMNGSGVCIVADPAVAAASAKILAVSALLAIIAFFN